VRACIIYTEFGCGRENSIHWPLTARATFLSDNRDAFTHAVPGYAPVYLTAALDLH